MSEKILNEEHEIDTTPKSDVIFKILFGDPKKPKLSLRLLNAIIETKTPITAIDIRKTELMPEFLGQKGVRIDILAKTSDGHLINVEIQKHNEHNMILRSLFHWSKLFSGQAVVSEKHENLKKTVCINILNFSMFDDVRYWHRDFIADAETNERLTDLLELHFLELPKVRKLPTKSELMFWMEFINNPESEKIKHFYETEPLYSEAREDYRRIIADPEVQELLRLKDKAEKDYNDALARKLAEGEKNDPEKVKPRVKKSERKENVQKPRKRKKL